MTVLRTMFAWHRPLMALAAANAVLVPLGLAGLLADPRVVTGMPVWAKPTKFAVSMVVYGLTWAWLYAMTRERSARPLRGLHAAGTLAAVTLGVEQVIIVLQAARGTTSHYNATTALDTTLWAAMAVSITLLWLGSLYLAAGLFRIRGTDPARALAVRAGAVLALVGMALGFLMTGPSQQPQRDLGIVGAHTVGALDGGPGIALLGWSTVGGDLRIPHFVGMHALQAIPLLVIALELLARRVPALSPPAVRHRLTAVGSAAFTGVLALLTWQALRGQSVVAPDATTVAAFGAIVAATAVALTWAVRPAESAVGVRPAAGAPS
jgi:hypothetical protein